LAGLLLLVLVPVAGRASAADWNPGQEIRRLSASLTPEETALGVVLLREAEYGLDAGGSLIRTQRWLVRIGDRTDPAWLDWIFPDPASSRIGEAALYDDRGNRTTSLAVLSGDVEGIASLRVTVPPGSAGKILALSVVRTQVRRANVDDLLILALDLPIREQRIQVEVPSGSSLAWAGSGGVLDPGKSSSSGVDRYEWTHLNEKAWRTPGILDDPRPALAFSLRKGPATALQPLADLEAEYVAAPFPTGLIPKGLTPERAGLRLLQELEQPSRQLTGFPRDYARSPGLLPAQGPWTPWEELLLAARGLSDLGFRCQVWWRPAFDIQDDGPATDRLFLTPVLKGVAPGGSVSWFVPGQAAFWGGVPPALAGASLMRLEGRSVQRETIPAGDAASNRLLIRWDLTLAEDGTAAGSLELTIRGAWAGPLSGGIPPSGDLSRWALERFGFVVPALRLSNGRAESLKSGYRVTFDANCVLAIVQGTDLLLRLPGSVPLRLSELSKVQAPARLRFPFLLEQQFEVRTPRGYRAVALPPKDQGKGGLLSQQLVHWPRKGIMEGSCRLLVKSAKIDEAMAADLSGAIDRYLQFGSVMVGLRK
jgi:hypothetical protein